MSGHLTPNEPVTEDQIFSAVDRLVSVARGDDDIHQILQLAVNKVRELLHTDRVVIYRFLPDQDAVVAVESVSPDFRPLLGELIYDPCFEHGWAERYRQGHISLVDDVENSHLEPCYIDLLTRLQVQANLVVPVFSGRELWALFIAHHCQHPRSWLPLDVQLMRQIANQVGQLVYQQQLQQQFHHARQSLEQQLSEEGPAPATLSNFQQGNNQSDFETLFRLVAQNLDQFLFVRDVEDGRFLYISPAYEKIWQCSRDNLYQDPHAWLDRVHPADRDKVMGSLSRQQQGNSVTRNYRIIRPDGEIRWIHAQVYMVKDAQHRPYRIVGWAEDCTERHRLTEVLQTTQDRLNTILDSTIAAISYVRVYPERRYMLDYLSAGSEAVFGFPAAAFMADQTLWDRRLPPEDYQDIMNGIFDRVFEGDTATVEYRFHHQDGSLRWIAETLISRWDSQADCWRVTVLATDITPQKETQLALNRRIEQEGLLRSITSHMRATLEFETILETTVAEVLKTFDADRVIIIKNEADGTYRLIQQVVNPPFSSLQEWPFTSAVVPSHHIDRFRQGQPVVLDDVEEEPWLAAMAQSLRGFQVKSAMVAPIIQSVTTADEAWGLLVIHVCAAIRRWQPFEAEMLQHTADQLAVAIHQSELYQQLQAANQELDRLSKTDALTLLSNRRHFDHYLQQEWQRLARRHAPISLILADVDHFKLFNDTYGHAQGDRCLADIARAISHAIKRPADLGARYGGEEFAVVLPDTTTAGAVQIITEIRRQLQDMAIPHGSSPVSAVVTLSFGMATVIPHPDQRLESLIQAADQALYAAKAQGRNRYQVFGSSLA